MRLSILLLIIGVFGITMGEPINVAIPAAVPSPQLVTSASSSFPTAPIVGTPAASSLHDQLARQLEDPTSFLDKPIDVEGAPIDVKDDETKVPVHLMPIKLDLEEGTGIENPTLDVNVDNNDVSHEGEGLVDIGGDVNLDITILAGLEADAANTAAGELTSFDGASEEEIKSIVEGVVDEQDLDAFDGISDADIDIDGDTMIEEQGKEEDEKDKAEHEKEEKKEEEEKANKGEGDKEKEKDKDVLGKEIEVESGIKVENPINHGEVTVNYVENLNLNLRGRHHKFRGLHHLARKLRLMKRIIKWFSKPVHQRLSLLRFHKFHKLRALELKLRLLKLKLLTDAIKMLRLARVVTMMKIKGDLTKLALGRVIMHKVRQPYPEDVKTDEEKTNLANRLARIRAFKNLLRARRLARFRTMMTSPIRSRRAFHSRAFTTSPIVSSWHRPQFMTSPIVASPWSHPSLSQFVTQPIVSSPNPYHLLALRGVEDDGTELNHPVVHPVEEEEDDSMNEGVYEDLIRQQHPLLSPTSHFDTQPIISEPLLQHSNMMLFGESEPSEHEETDETGYEHPMLME